MLDRPAPSLPASRAVPWPSSRPAMASSEIAKPVRPGISPEEPPPVPQRGRNSPRSSMGTTSGSPGPYSVRRRKSGEGA